MKLYLNQASPYARLIRVLQVNENVRGDPMSPLL